MKPNRWQVEWVAPNGDHKTRMFKIEAHARAFAANVACAPDYVPEIWEMLGA